MGGGGVVIERYTLGDEAWMVLVRERGDAPEDALTLENAEGGQIGLPGGRTLTLADRGWSLWHEEIAGGIRVYHVAIESDGSGGWPTLVLSDVTNVPIG